MVLLSKREFQSVSKIGFKCKEHFTRTAHGRKYAITDDDYFAMCKFFKEKFEVTKYYK